MSSLLAVTMGDPGGIGPEIILKTLKSGKYKNLLVIGAIEPFKQAAETIKQKFSWPVISDFSKYKPSPIVFLDIEHRRQEILKEHTLEAIHPFSKNAASLPNAAMAWAALETAVTLSLEKKVKGIVTAPLNKTCMRLLDPNFTGHTEYLAERSDVSRYAMMFVGKKLKVTLVTIHVALKNVSKKITADLILEKIELTHQFLKDRLKIKTPKLAVAALNPHGRETGTEEDEFIVPAIRKAQEKGFLVEGPLPGDQIFHDAYHGMFDAVISMYHDQALAPFKMISFYDGVNTTLGLPFVRTSPDHGTAYDIAYQNKANPESMKSSIELALKLIQ